jgi:hypothetical protein
LAIRASVAAFVLQGASAILDSYPTVKVKEECKEERRGKSIVIGVSGAVRAYRGVYRVGNVLGNNVLIKRADCNYTEIEPISM